MPNDQVTVRMPWEAEPEPEPAPAQPLEETIAALQRDFTHAVANTAIVVHSNNAAFAMTANTARGQIVPRNEVLFSDGTTVEVQDIGMCQPGVPHMSVREIMSRIWKTANELGLELVKAKP